MPWFVYVAIPVFIGLFIWAAVVAARKARERREAFAALAARREWRFSPEPDRSIASAMSMFEEFSQGHSRYGYNTLRGYLRIDGRQYDVTAGDYTYKITRSTGKSTTTTTYEFSYVVADCPFPNVPDLTVRREGIFDKIGAAIGMPDINFESAEFSRKFYVKGPDRKFAFNVIHPRMIEFLMANSPPPISLRDGRACFGSGATWTPEEFDQQIEFVSSFFALWPEYLQDDLEARS